MLDNERLAAIRERHEKATKGPWWNDDISWAEIDDITVWCGDKDDPECLLNIGPNFSEMSNEGGKGTQSWNDAEFIAHARADVPDLLAEVERLKQENAILTDQLAGIWTRGD